MAKKKKWALTDLNLADSLYLFIKDVRYELISVQMTYAINEIPQAQCMLAIGRNASTGGFDEAQIHKQAQFQQMESAQIFFSPRGEFRPDGTPWPAGPEIIFDGYFVGFTYQKVRGKVQIVANLIHWLADLAMSSSLTPAGHVANPAGMNAAAVLSVPATFATGQHINLSTHVGAALIESDLATDVWASIKTLFCALASKSVLAPGPFNQCAALGSPDGNTRARKALSRMEGVATTAQQNDSGGVCSNPYVYGVPLAPHKDIAVPFVTLGLSRQINWEMMSDYAGVTFWDKLIGSFCPQLGLAVVPMIDSALVIADTPAYRRLEKSPDHNTPDFHTGFWKSLSANDYESFSFKASLEQPLRAVGTVSVGHLQTMAGQTERAVGDSGFPLIGGCFVVDSVSPYDGIVQYVPAPYWVMLALTGKETAGTTTAMISDAPSPDATNPVPAMAPKDPLPVTLGRPINRLFERHSHTIYVNNMLRGRAGTLTSFLRFDIAPGSILQIGAAPEQFIGLEEEAEDDLAITMYGCVSRLTISINAEAGSASTTYLLTQMRTEKENTTDRTSVDGHPLFDQSIHGNGKHGSPLLASLDLE